MFDQCLRSPLRFFFAAAVLAAMLCLYPARVEDAPQQAQMMALENTPQPAGERPVGADLSERTAADGYLHRTLYYAPCGHSVQRRERLPAALTGLTRAALEPALEAAIPGAVVTGFSSAEVDISLSTDIPCPLHWVLRAGEDGLLCVMQNRDGESLEIVRRTDVQTARAGEAERPVLLEGMIFDDVQALEGYLEGISS